MPSAKQSVKHTTLHQRVIRADGRVEDLGIVSYWHRRMLCRGLFRIEYIIRRLRQRLEKE